MFKLPAARWALAACVILTITQSWLLFSKSPASPLTEFKLIYGLQNYIEPHHLAVLIADRGVDFQLSPAIERDLREAAGSVNIDEVIHAIIESNTARSRASKKNVEESRTEIVEIHSTPPGAEVYLDDVRRGMTGPEGILRLADVTPGAHHLRLAMAGYSQWERPLTITSGKEIVLDALLTKVAAGEAPATSTATNTPPAKPSPEEVKAQFQLLQQQFNRAQALYRENRFAEAGPAFEQAIPFATEKNVKVVAALAGDSYRKARQFQKAEELYLRAIQADPGDADLHNNLGNVYAAWGKTTEAGEEFRKVAELNPEHASAAYFNLGAIAYNAGRVEEAARAFKRSREADPKYANAYYYEGLALMDGATVGPDQEVVPTPGTVEALQNYLSLAPTGQFAPQARKILESLQVKN